MLCQKPENYSDRNRLDNLFSILDIKYLCGFARSSDFFHRRVRSLMRPARMRTERRYDF